MWLATENGANLNVYYSDAPYTSFSGPITLANNINDDDIGVVTALPNGTVGVLWSNQNTQRFGFKVHVDGQPPATWSADEVPASGSALQRRLGHGRRPPQRRRGLQRDAVCRGEDELRHGRISEDRVARSDVRTERGIRCTRSISRAPEGSCC